MSKSPEAGGNSVSTKWRGQECWRGESPGAVWVPSAKPKPGTEEHSVHVTEVISEEYVTK